MDSELTVEPVDRCISGVRIVVGDRGFTFRSTSISIFEQPDFRFASFLIDLKCWERYNRNNNIYKYIITNDKLTLMTPIAPKNASSSDSVTDSGRPETNTLSSIVIRSSPPAAPPLKIRHPNEISENGLPTHCVFVFKWMWNETCEV